MAPRPRPKTAVRRRWRRGPALLFRAATAAAAAAVAHLAFLTQGRSRPLPSPHAGTRAGPLRAASPYGPGSFPGAGEFPQAGAGGLGDLQAELLKILNGTAAGGGGAGAPQFPGFGGGGAPQEATDEFIVKRIPVLRRLKPFLMPAFFIFCYWRGWVGRWGLFQGFTCKSYFDVLGVPLRVLPQSPWCGSPFVITQFWSDSAFKLIRYLWRLSRGEAEFPPKPAPGAQPGMGGLGGLEGLLGGLGGQGGQGGLGGLGGLGGQGFPGEVDARATTTAEGVGEPFASAPPPRRGSGLGSSVGSSWAPPPPPPQRPPQASSSAPIVDADVLPSDNQGFVD